MTQPTLLHSAQINHSTQAPAAARDAPPAAKAKGIMEVSVAGILFVLPASSRSWLYSHEESWHLFWTKNTTGGKQGEGEKNAGLYQREIKSQPYTHC